MAESTTTKPTPERKPDRDLGEVPLERITLGPNVREVDPATVTDLVNSIAAQGLLQPVLVADHELAGNDGQPPYVLVAGFRRYAAFKRLHLKAIPARWRDLKATEVLEVQLVEYVQREDLSELEEAKGFQRYLAQVPGASQDQLAKRIGKHPSYIANRLRLLKLDPGVQKNLETGKISASHAEVLASAPPVVQRALAKKTLDRDLSVRQLEQERGWRVDSYNRQKKDRDSFDSRIAKSKFPTCPALVDGKAHGVKARFLMGWQNRELTCGKHEWDPATGKVHARRAERRDSFSSPERREPPKPTLPVVPEVVPFEASPDDLWSYFFGKMHGVGFTRFDVSPGSKTFEVRFAAEIPIKGPADLPGFTVGGRNGQKGVVIMHGANDYLQGTDRERRKLAAQREVLIAWGKKLRGTPVQKTKAAGKK